MKTLPIALLLVSSLSVASSSEMPSTEKKVKSTAGINFVEVDAASFMMGSPHDDGLRGDDEDQVAVRLSKFWISETEVSWRQLNEITGAGSAEYVLRRPIKAEELDLPVVGKGYFELDYFFRALTSRCIDEKVFASGAANLPTEAQWEYVAKNGSNAILSERALWSIAQENNENIGPLSNGPRVRVCGYSKPNRFGCRDMLGNVLELCRDVYTTKLPGGDDPFVHSGDIRQLFFVVKGGNCFGDISDSRASRRGFVKPGAAPSHVGFRVVWESQK
ncbi:MAG: SUMF1/EgtB/PvdO family nonheme iron enzyme [Verrucomicrobia bacterium]|nr:SUMF1/EgtB/PvdO family nonheme iron enzyme [Verrucomicrobiota bacterium]